MDYYSQFIKEKRAGLYKGYKYPNLIEMQGHSCFNFNIGYFANVTEELVLAAFRGEEELTDDEIWKVAHYNNFPYSVLICPKVIMLDTGEERCRNMIAEVDELYAQLKEMERKGNPEAEKYLRHADFGYQSFLKAVYDNRLSYVHYFGTKKELAKYIFFARPKPAIRGISTTKGGTV